MLACATTRWAWREGRVLLLQPSTSEGGADGPAGTLNLGIARCDHDVPTNDAELGIFTFCKAMPCRQQVKPVLAMIIKNANKKADEMAERCGAEKGANTLRFFPDFDGSFLKDLRVKDCDWTWRVWIVYNGEVMTNLRSSTPEAAQEFMNAYDAIASKAGIEAKA